MKRRIRIPTASLFLLALAASPTPAQDAPPVPQLDRLKSHVHRLCAPEFAGRRGAGGASAAAFIAGELRAIGLEPLFGSSYFQVIPASATDSTPLGANVGAFLPGADPSLSDEVILVSAHFDHLGIQGGRLYPGADDNASGVAMVLEVARSLQGQAERPARGIAFVAFDLEEEGLLGSRHFVDHPPWPLEHLRLFLTADLIGRSLGGVCEPACNRGFPGI